MCFTSNATWNASSTSRCPWHPYDPVLGLELVAHGWTPGSYWLSSSQAGGIPERSWCAEVPWSQRFREALAHSRRRNRPKRERRRGWFPPVVVRLERPGFPRRQHALPYVRALWARVVLRRRSRGARSSRASLATQRTRIRRGLLTVPRPRRPTSRQRAAYELSRRRGGADTRRTPAEHERAQLVRLDPVQKPSPRQGREGGDDSASTAPSVAKPAAYATVADVRNTARRDSRSRRPRSSSGPSPNRGCMSSNVGEARKAEAPPSVHPTTKLGPEAGRQPPPAGRDRDTARAPIVAWLNRGARESITSRSRYGSASASLPKVCEDATADATSSTRWRATRPEGWGQTLAFGTRAAPAGGRATGRHLAHWKSSDDPALAKSIRCGCRPALHSSKPR